VHLAALHGGFISGLDPAVSDRSQRCAVLKGRRHHSTAARTCKVLRMHLIPRSQTVSTAYRDGDRPGRLGGRVEVRLVKLQ